MDLADAVRKLDAATVTVAVPVGHSGSLNKRTRSVLPVVRDRQALVSTLRGLLGDLGLKRRGKNEPSLGDYLAARGGNGQPQGDEHTDARAGGSTEARSHAAG